MSSTLTVRNRGLGLVGRTNHDARLRRLKQHAAPDQWSRPASLFTFGVRPISHHHHEGAVSKPGVGEIMATSR